MRLFVSVDPPPDAVQHLDDFLAARRGSGPELRWSSPELWHLTLAFMGAAPERVVEDLLDAVSVVAADAAPLGLSIVGGGCFPDLARAKVLWAGVAGAVEGLGRLSRSVRSVCSVAGAAPAGGPFEPHLTLGRFGRATDATRWVRVLDTYAGPPWVAADIAVVASHLPRERGHRPRHEVLARVPLGGS